MPLNTPTYSQDLASTGRHLPGRGEPEGWSNQPARPATGERPPGYQGKSESPGPTSMASSEWCIQSPGSLQDMRTPRPPSHRSQALDAPTKPTSTQAATLNRTLRAYSSPRVEDTHSGRESEEQSIRLFGSYCCDRRTYCERWAQTAPRFDGSFSLRAAESGVYTLSLCTNEKVLATMADHAKDILVKTL